MLSFLISFVCLLGDGLIEDCPANHILCRNRNCVPEDKKCDGKDDCEDGTDEQKCGKYIFWCY